VRVASQVRNANDPQLSTALSPREAVVQKVLKLVSYAVLVLMASAVVYSGIIGITYWTGIGV
jgi:hypothetical protein